MSSRRDFLKTLGLAAGALALPRWTGRAFAQAIQPTLDPLGIPQFVTPLLIPPAMPRSPKQWLHRNTNFYEIGVRQFRQQILPAGSPKTTVWGYGATDYPSTFHFPSFTLENRVDSPTRIKWVNQLVDRYGRYLPHLLPVDPTLHWANPPGGLANRDMRPLFASTPQAYTGPVPIVTHVHGAHSYQESDGYPEAWYLPQARDIPSGFARSGTFYDRFKESSFLGGQWEPGAAVFQYPNDQRAATLWYHDHSLGITRLNVYAGPAGFYLLRGGHSDLPAGVLPGPAPQLGDPPNAKYYEVPLVIQDRAFNADGSLFYPDSREFFDGFPGPYIPTSDISPIFNPEYFGNTLLVNGNTWPAFEVEQRRYRFRFLNGCNSRFLVLKIVTDRLASRPANPAVPFWQIGTEGGFLPAPVELPQLLMGLAERADVIVDFAEFPVGTELYLINEGPDEPFGGGVGGVDFPAANLFTTGQVMKFVVTRRTSRDRSVPPQYLQPPKFKQLGREHVTRKVSLNELDSDVLPGIGPREAVLGTVTPDGTTGIPLPWMAAPTETPKVGATEVWELHNFTEDAHPIHLHLVQFQVVNRQPENGTPRPPEAWESGDKDTVVAYPGEITRIKARFDMAGRYVWHCHILEHEDNEMMRPYQVVK